MRSPVKLGFAGVRGFSNSGEDFFYLNDEPSWCYRTFIERNELESFSCQLRSDFEGFLSREKISFSYLNDDPSWGHRTFIERNELESFSGQLRSDCG
jgi:hypothetical protein